VKKQLRVSEKATTRQSSREKGPQDRKKGDKQCSVKINPSARNLIILTHKCSDAQLKLVVQNLPNRVARHTAYHTLLQAMQKAA
jgi:hypothetical protein